MKKLLLLLIGGSITLGANAQYARSSSVIRTNNVKKAPNVNFAPLQKTALGNIPVAGVNEPHHVAAKTTASCFITQDFSTANLTGLPAGWTSGSYSPAGPVGWHWSATPSTAPFTIGAIHSTTAANGWMIYDSDSIGGGGSTTIAPSGWMQTGAYNCTGHSTVRLNFEEFFEKFQDSCFVWVSTTPGFATGTYTSYAVLPNNAIATNVSTANPQKVHINISAVASNQPTVYIRFVYYGAPGGGYQWMIDDMCLSELDPVDVASTDASVIFAGGSDVGGASYGSIPLSMADTVYPVSYISNYGATAEPTTSVNAKILNGATSVYDQTVTVNAPVNGVDTMATFFDAGTFPGYLPTATGSFTVPIRASVTGTDADLTNDTSTTRFNVTDSIYSQAVPGISSSGGLYVHRVASGSTAALSYSPGTEFVIPPGKSDTLTGVAVAFSSSTAAGQKVGVQIFHFTPAGTSGTWDYDGTTTFRTLSASDVSSASTAVYAYFHIDPVASGHQIVLDGGTTGRQYAAVVKGENNTGAVVVLQGKGPADKYAGSYGVADTSMNDGAASQQFGQGHLPFGNSLTPWITLRFGNVDYTAVNDINSNLYSIGDAFPNPANSAVTVPFTMKENATVTVTLSNVVGQVVRTQTVAAEGGVATKATFATSNLASGIYLYTVMVNGQQKTGRVSVTH